MAEPEEVVDQNQSYVHSQFEGLELGQRHGSLPHENTKTGSVNLTMGKWRRLPI